MDVPVDGEEQGQGGHRLLPSRQVVHGPEPLPRGHAIVVDAVQVGLLWVLRAEESLAHGTHRVTTDAQPSVVSVRRDP